MECHTRISKFYSGFQHFVHEYSSRPFQMSNLTSLWRSMLKSSKYCKVVSCCDDGLFESNASTKVWGIWKSKTENSTTKHTIHRMYVCTKANVNEKNHVTHSHTHREQKNINRITSSLTLHLLPPLAYARTYTYTHHFNSQSSIVNGYTMLLPLLARNWKSLWMERVYMR